LDKMTYERDQPLTEEEWQKSLDINGRLLDATVIKKRIFHGGVSPELRPTIWKFLLNFYPWTSTEEERQQILKSKTEEYDTMRKQWQAFSSVQLSNFPELLKRKDQIEKDVHRTDINNPYYKQPGSIDSLRNILMTHCFYNWNLGYIQGMNTLLAPILSVLNDEVSAFWCFVGIMKIYGNNFRLDSNLLYEQLTRFSKFVTFLIPNLHDHLLKIQSCHMTFCLRWFLLQFSDHLGTELTKNLWEIFWTELIPDFFLFFCCAVLLKISAHIVKEQLDFAGIMLTVQSVSISLDETLNLAQELYHFFHSKCDSALKPKFG